MRMYVWQHRVALLSVKLIAVYSKHLNLNIPRSFMP